MSIPDPSTRRELLRRVFIASAGVALVPRRAAAAPSAPCRGTLVGMSRMRAKSGGERFAVVRIDLQERPLRIRPIAIPFFGHGVAFDPQRPRRALVFEKHGPGCCEVDLIAGRMTRVIPPTPGRQFYGHGTFSADGQRLYATETADGTKLGFLAVRDGKSLAATGALDSHGRAPHDVTLADGGRALLVGNGGAALARAGADPRDAPSLVWLALPAGAALRRVALDDPRLNVGHVALLAPTAALPLGGVAVVSAPRDGLDPRDPTVHGGVSFLRGAATSASAVRDAKVANLRGETLSLARGPAGVVFATSPEGGALSVWDPATGALRAWRTDWPQPRGVAIDLGGRCLALSHGAAPEVRLLDAATLAPLPGGHLPAGWISGSHLYVVDLGLDLR